MKNFIRVPLIVFITLGILLVTSLYFNANKPSISSEDALTVVDDTGDIKFVDDILIYNPNNTMLHTETLQALSVLSKDYVILVHPIGRDPASMVKTVDIRAGPPL